MDNGFILRTVFFLLLIATASEAIFFDYPKKALMDFLHSLKEKKEAAAAAKKSHDDVHHYHLHYYPVPVSLVFDEHIKLVHGKQELDHLHREEHKSSGWNDQEYKHVPHPDIIIPVSQHHEIVSDHWPHDHQSHDPDGLTLQDQIDIAAIQHGIESQHTHHQKHHSVEPRHQTHISLHLPFHQEIIFQPPAPAPKKEEKKAHLFSAFFQKLEHIKNSLFSSNEDKKSSSHDQCEDKIEKPVASITSKLRAGNAAYAIYFHPKNLRRF